jgi:hypothetical protein
MQRRYRMQQRSPSIFWLLLTATICVDALAVIGVVDGSSLLVLQALVYGELSVCCIWTGLSREKSIWTQAVAWLGVIAAIAILSFACAAATASKIWGWLPWSLPQAILQAALLLMFLWVLERTRFWQSRSGVTAKWRFSLGQLFTIMTVVAVLAAWFHKHYEFYMDGLWNTLATIGGKSVLGLGCAISWSLALHWLMRFAITVALAILVGVGCALLVWGPFVYHEHLAYFIIQAVVLSLWLGLTPILHKSPTPADAEA